MSKIVVTTEPKLPNRVQKTTPVISTTSSNGSTWLVQFEFVERNETRVPVGFHLIASPDQDDSVITTRGMREIQFSTLFEEWLRKSAEPTPRKSPSKNKGPKRGEPLTTELLTEVADLYRKAINQGLSPLNFIAKEMGISKSTATKRVIRARRESFLGPTTPGKQGEQNKKIRKVMPAVFDREEPIYRSITQATRSGQPKLVRPRNKQTPKPQKRGEKE